VAVPLVPAAVRRGFARGALTILTQLLRFPVVRALFGLAVGFGAAAVTFFVVDRYGTDEIDESMITVHEDLDHDGFCAVHFDGARAMRVGDDYDDWLCGRRLNGIWSPTPIEHAELCAWQFGAGTEPRLRPNETAFDWICIEPGRS